MDLLEPSPSDQHWVSNGQALLRQEESRTGKLLIYNKDELKSNELLGGG